MIAQLAIKSLRNRKFTAALTAISIALSVMLLLGVERMRNESRTSFTATVSGTDLIVGARSSPVHLLLYSVFHVGNPTNNLRWESYLSIAQRPEVAWVIPFSLGDTHRGFRVMGTTAAFFEHFRFGGNRSLSLAQGNPFANAQEAVLGADVARRLGYRVGERIVLAHGAGDVSFITHDEHPLRVSGVLARTGTPVDRTVHVSLQALEDIHARASTDDNDPLAAATRHNEAQHAAISAFLLGLKNRGAALAVQRVVNEYEPEPLTAILPGATLQEVWEILGTVERTLFAVSVLVVIVGLAGMLVALLTSLNERRREMAVLRSAGARPSHVFALILGEAAFLTLTGMMLGVAVLYGGLILGRGWLETQFGLFIELAWPSAHELGLLALVGIAGVLIGLIPAYRIYRRSLTDGMTIRI
ncbi:MAG: ABC transporter permease [Burkholderiales bacterium]